MTKKNLPKKLMNLTKSYSGDESWEKFADCFDVDAQSINKLARKFSISPSTSKVVLWHIREQYAEQWFDKRIPVLYDFRPIDLINDYENGEICIRVILRRMH